MKGAAFERKDVIIIKRVSSSILHKGGTVADDVHHEPPLPLSAPALRHVPATQERAKGMCVRPNGVTDSTLFSLNKYTEKQGTELVRTGVTVQQTLVFSIATLGLSRTHLIC